MAPTTTQAFDPADAIPKPQPVREITGMTTSNIALSEAQMKKAAGRMKGMIAARVNEGRAVSHAWMLECLSHGFFGKPYGEVRTTLLNAPDEGVVSTKKTGNVAPRVILIEYRSELILTVDGEYVTGSFPGTDLEIPKSAMRSQAENLAHLNDSVVGFVELPELLPDDWETDDILELADRLGYFTYKTPFHELIERDPLVVFKNSAVRWGMDGDYLDNLKGEIEAKPWRSVVSQEIAWSPEFQSGADKYELYFSLQDLGRAKEVKPCHWVIRSEELDCTFEFILIFEG